MDPNPKDAYDLAPLLPDVGDLVRDRGYVYRVSEVRVARRVDAVYVSFEAERWSGGEP
jgi:hypothetical protein